MFEAAIDLVGQFGKGLRWIAYQFRWQQLREIARSGARDADAAEAIRASQLRTVAAALEELPASQISVLLVSKRSRAVDRLASQLGASGQTCEERNEDRVLCHASNRNLA